jgi:hypothetical protein
MRPAGVVVSMLSVIERKPAPAAPIHDVQHVFQGARQTIQLQDDNGVALAQMVEQSMQLRPIPSPAGRGLLEQASATGGLKRFRLQGVILCVSLGDTGIA